MTKPIDDGTRRALSRPGASELACPYVLRVVAGPDAGAELIVDPDGPGRLLIGQSAACSLRLADPEVSRRHLAVQIEGHGLRVTDLDSTNGTYVGGVAMLDARLEGGEHIRLGGSTLEVVRGDASLRPRPREKSFGSTIGGAKVMQRLYPLCRRLAESDIPVVIEGETGTGKEQLAESLHATGPRATGPFIVFDCTAVAPNLIESELFGHEKGAFTGAQAARAGVFERADGGTLLIDEVGDLPLELQSKLLRAIERFQVTRVGGSEAIDVDVRVIAATRRDLDRLVYEGDFRDDLFHRLAVSRIELPPLRERDGDVPRLARHFWTQRKGDPSFIPPALMRRWESYRWPGNVRELKNAVARRMALGDLAEPSNELEVDGSTGTRASVLPPGDRAPDVIELILAESLPLSEARQRAVDELERRYIARVLEAHGGNVTRAAAASGLDRRHFHRLKAKAEGRKG